MKLLVVGLDGATFDIIQPMVAQNRLPNLARLMKTGAWGILNSAIPPISPSAWRTFATGKNPGKHGVYDFQTWNPDYSRQPRPIQWQKHKTVLRLLTESGRRVISIDVPFSYPPEQVNGLVITGYPTPRTPDTIFTYPADLPQQLQKKGFDVKLGWPEDRIDVHPDFFKAWQQTMQERGKLVNYLFHEEEWDLFTVVFGITDTLAHTLWHYVDPAHPASQDKRANEYKEALLHGYEQCDYILGQLWQAMDDDTHLIVLSDHGFGTIRPRQWFALKAYTEIGWLRRVIRELRPGSKAALRGALAQGGVLIESSAIDYSRSFTLPSDMGTHIYLNRKDRFHNGLLNSAEAQEMAKVIRHMLLNVTDTIDGLPVIKEVYLANDIYHGEAFNDAPDLVIEYLNRYKPDKASTTPNPNLEGGHVMEGILLAWGNGIQTKHIPDTEIVNLASTMLYMLDEPIPADMDGKVLTELLNTAWLDEHPIQHSNEHATMKTTDSIEYTAEEESAVNEQLRALGYID
ncbi:MAG: hypothetical protein B6242_15230 [Anaerolineaceae bacterium 4572_78]|nr:MAG: hypothetical protein B6242_15230 [Anaerolineaceae bacterium 4572_78]